MLYSEPELLPFYPNYNDLLKLIENSNGCSTYLHTTGTIAKCESICRNGLVYTNFLKTVDYVDDFCSLSYMLNIRKAYGDYTIIIQIDHSIEGYEPTSSNSINEEGEEVFILPARFVKGYFNRLTSDFIQNIL